MGKKVRGKTEENTVRAANKTQLEKGVMSFMNAISYVMYLREHDRITAQKETFVLR